MAAPKKPKASKKPQTSAIKAELKVTENRKIIFTEAMLARIYEMSRIRLPLETIATLIGVSKSTLEREAKKNDAVSEALSKGRAEAQQTIYDHAFKQAISGLDSRMTIFYLKTQHRWKEPTSIELAGIDGKPIEFEEKDLSSKERLTVLKGLLKVIKLTDE